MKFLNLGPNDEVLVPAITDMGTVLGVMLQRAVPIFVDVDPITQNMDPNDIERHVTRYKGRLVGTFGDVTCFSFQQSKHMSTGDGGMAMARKDMLCGRKLVYCQDKAWPGEVYRDHLFLAPNYHMTDLQAAVGIAQFHKLDWMIEQRRESGLHLSELLKDIEGLYPPVDTELGTQTFFEYALPFDSEQFTADIKMQAQAVTAEGVKCSPNAEDISCTLHKVLAYYRK